LLSPSHVRVGPAEQSLPEVEAEQVGAGKDDETEGLGRLGGNRRSEREQREFTLFAEPQGGKALPA
jgi:hypothetical protein